MLKVKCDACGSPYEVDPRRIPKAGLKMRCSSCGGPVFVHPEASAGGAAPTDISLSLSLDLPAPKPAPKPHSQVFGDLSDLPATKGSPGRTAAVPLAPSFEDDLTDLPGLRRGPASGPSEFELELDLPAPKRTAARPELDLPALKGAGPAAPQAQAFAKAPPIATEFEFDVAPKGTPESRPLPAPVFSPKRPAPALSQDSFPKDSLAIDPEPMRGLASGAMGHLDDVRTQPKSPAHPAPSQHAILTAPSPRTGGSLPRDSLDLPQGFGALGDNAVELVGMSFEAPKASAPAPTAKEPRNPLAIPFDDIDLPAPLAFTSDVALSTKHTPSQARGRTAQGQMSRDSLDLPPPKSEAARVPAAAAPAALTPDFELDLPAPARTPQGAGLQGQPSFDAFAGKGGTQALPAPQPMNATMALSIDDLELPGASAADPDGEVLSLPSLSNAPGPLLEDLPSLDPFADLGAPKFAAQTMELDSLLEPEARFAPPKPSAHKQAKHHGAAGGSAFGELDFGLPDDEALPVDLPVPAAMPMPIPAPADARAQPDADLAQLEHAADEAPSTNAQKKAKTPRKAAPAWVWPVGIVTALLGTGVTLGLATDHGWFGVYLVEQFLPEAGDPKRIAEAITAAEQKAESDTHADLRKSLLILSDARNEAGLSRELLARSLLHESLYQLRFEDDMNSAQRSVALLTRVMERGTSVSGLALARAAHAVRTGDLTAARSLLAANDKPNDPYAGLVAGELALREQKPDEALQAFQRAQDLGAGARAAWGITRAHIAKQNLDAADAANQATLKLSPRHAGALIWAGERALARGDLKAAMTSAKQALGWVDIGGKRVRAAKADRARAFALQGLVEERSEHPNEAQAAYEEALKADPHRLDVLLGSGRMLMRIGRARDALTRYDSALSLKSADKKSSNALFIEAGVGAAQALLALERGREALERLQRLDAENPEHFDVRLWLGHAQVALEQWDEAEVSFKKVIELVPDNFSGYVALSQLLFKRKRPEEASRVLAAATGKVQDSAEVRRLLGNSELVRNHLPEAIAQFTSALRFDDHDAGALFGLSIAQRKHGDLDAAEKNLARLASVDPAFPGLATEHGLLREMRGDHAGAAEVYRHALTLRPQDLDLKLRLGAALVTAGRVDEADGLLREVIKERPNSAEGEYFLGRILFARHDMAQALQHFEKAVNLEPTRAEFRTHFAWTHLEHGNLSGALTQVNAALERDPASGDAHWVLGRVQLRMGAVKDALESFQKTLRLKPGRYEALAGLGDAYDQLRELRKAIKTYQEAVRAVPTEGFWWYRLASLHVDKGHREEARAAFAEAVLHGDKLSDKPTWVADAHYAYAESLRDGKRTADALDHYRTFLQIAPASHTARDEVTRTVRSLER